MVEIEAKKIECPSCGADLRYLPHRLECHYCGHQEPFETEPYLYRFAPFESLEPNPTSKKYRCPSCGASFESDSVSQLCPYCDTALVGEFINPLKPRCVIPFVIEPVEAAKLLKKHIGSLWFAPSAFKESYSDYKALRGRYLPKWLFNTKVHVTYSGQRGIYYYVAVTRYVNGKAVRTNERRVRWYPVHGSVNLDFRYIDVNAKKDSDPAIADFHFDFQSAKTIDDRYLSGHETKEYDLSSYEAFQLAQASLHPAIRSAIRRDIGGDTQRILSYDPRFYDVEMEHTLVPVYHASVLWDGKEYDFYIDGMDGEVVGDRPYSWLKIALAVVFILALVAGGLYLADRYGYLQ
ncbi:MAG: hypothetical protein C6H99_04740 [Epsilonproteobacteria bacterium]|nr:hypothetical protein [Campylobacterota bacterium]NPA63790.1 hypothetical protein [Campylobacterota bacterium]